MKSENIHSLHTGNLIAKALNLLGDALDNAGVEMLQKIGMSKEVLEKNVENIVNAAKTLGHDISGPVSDFLERSKGEDQKNIQHDDFTMRPS